MAYQIPVLRYFRPTQQAVTILNRTLGQEEALTDYEIYIDCNCMSISFRFLHLCKRVYLLNSQIPLYILASHY